MAISSTIYLKLFCFTEKDRAVEAVHDGDGFAGDRLGVSAGLAVLRPHAAQDRGVPP